MNQIAIAAAALFLLAVPGPSFAQDSNTTTGGGTAAGTSDSSAPGTGNKGGSSRQSCPDAAPHEDYSRFSPDCRRAIDSWAAAQTGASVAFEGDIAVGTVLPDTVEIVEVPDYNAYGYAYLNDRRVLVDRSTHTIVHVY